MPAPARTPEQRAAALDRALQVRRDRAALRAAIKDGSVRAIDVVKGVPRNDQWAALPVVWLLRALPGLGEVRVARIMESMGISQSRRLQGLSDRQRSALIEELTCR